MVNYILKNPYSAYRVQNELIKFQEEGQAYYAGGSETSGQQILGPPKKKDGRDFVKEMFKKAREHGAEAVDPSSMGNSIFNKYYLGEL